MGYYSEISVEGEELYPGAMEDARKLWDKLFKNNEAYHWPPNFMADEDGTVYIDEDAYRKWYYDDIWAPFFLLFMKPGSRITFTGEDGAMWGYERTENGVVELEGVITWEPTFQIYELKGNNKEEIIATVMSEHLKS